MSRTWRYNRTSYWVRERLAGDVLGLTIGAVLLLLAAITALGPASRDRVVAAAEAALAVLVVHLWVRARRRWHTRFTRALNLHREGLRVPSRCGTVVRSQAEAMIADELAEAGIRFAYEQRLVADDMSSRVPDFTIWDGFGTVWYLEHLGMLRSEEYRGRWVASQRWYDRHFPGRLLITTPEDLEGQIGAVIGAILGASSS